MQTSVNLTIPQYKVVILHKASIFFIVLQVGLGTILKLFWTWSAQYFFFQPKIYQAEFQST